MKKILLLFTLLFTHLTFAQYTGDNVKYYVGEGDLTAYLVVDFKDDTDDRSYVWGIRFNDGETLTYADFLTAIDDAEPNFTHETGFGGGFLNDIIFNSHSGLASNPDWWSTWSGETFETLSMNSGISESLIDGRWYGASYGFSNPTAQAPVTPIPAYHSLWFSNEDIVTWFGEGENQSILIIDFGTDTEELADSFAFGFNYSTETISVEDALELLQNQVADFSYELTDNEITNFTWNGYSGEATGENSWKSYTGTDLSNWTTATNLSDITLENNEWIGFSFAERRPFIPRDEAEELFIAEVQKNKINIYPNPANDKFYVNTNESVQVRIFDLSGKLILTQQYNNNGVNVSGISKGIYIVELSTATQKLTQKLIVK